LKNLKTFSGSADKMVEYPINKVGAILLIAVVLILLMIGGGQLIWKSAMSGIKWIDSQLGMNWFNEEKDITLLNEKAQANFDALIQEINSCASSQKKDCKCKSQKGFNDFSDIYAIQIVNEQNKDKIKLLYTNERNELTKDKKDLNAIKCYATKNNVKSLSIPIMIRFGDNTYLEDEDGNDEEFLKDSKDILYKTQNNEICWLVEERNVEYC
jgi:hypothetical protein